MVMATIAFLITLLYSVLLYKLKLILAKDSFTLNSLFKPQHELSIIIPIKNEAQNISRVIESLDAQDYPQKLIHIIFVDDNSNDSFLDEINRAKLKCRGIKIRVINNTGNGKKSAITTGINLADTKYVVLTDADVYHSRNWLSTIAAYCETYQPTLLVGAVFMNSSTFFEDFQACDYAAMQIVGASLLLEGYPVLCSGANLTVHRESFLKANPYNSNLDIASGDDMFLMQSFAEEYGKETIHFLNSANSFAFTNAKENLFGYLEQRLRWASKTKYYFLSSTGLLGLVVFIVHLILLILLFASMYNQWFLWPFGFFLAAKTSFEYLLFREAEKKFKLKFPLKWFIVFQFLQIVFIPNLALLSVFKKNTNWKT
jgi:cellulose synthase/poly-beta-1,6-N-acetylglucosamine synthase-like glycosyltransferase